MSGVFSVINGFFSVCFQSGEEPDDEEFASDDSYESKESRHKPAPLIQDVQLIDNINFEYEMG